MTKQSRYIFETFAKDFTFLILPSLAMLSFLFAVEIDSAGALVTIMTLLTFVAFDAGHSMYTFVRMTTIKGEWRASKRYFIMPILIFAIIVFWVESGAPYLFSMIVYYSVYHYAKQHWGILRWYERLNADYLNLRKYFVYATFFLPLIAFHFRDPSIRGIYGSRDFFLFPNETLFIIFSGLSMAAICGWVALEISHRKTKMNNGIWIIFAQMVIHTIAVLFGQSTWQVFGPVLTMHSVSYFFLTHKVYEKNFDTKYNVKWVLGLIVAIVCLAYPMRMLEAYHAEEMLPPWINGIVLAIAVTPGLVHYHFDSFLWRHSNSSFAKVFN